MNETELSNAPAPASFIAEVLRRDSAAVAERLALARGRERHSEAPTT